jgi:hypothetical protein
VLAAREIDAQYLRGALTSEADRAPFMNADAKGPVGASAPVEMLQACGLVVRNPINRHLQFIYDPVAKLLAAWRILQKAKEPGIRSMIQRIRAAEGSGLALALAAAGTGGASFRPIGWAPGLTGVTAWPRSRAMGPGGHRSPPSW